MRACIVCGELMLQRSGEQNSDWQDRKTCSRACASRAMWASRRGAALSPVKREEPLTIPQVCAIDPLVPDRIKRHLVQIMARELRLLAPDRKALYQELTCVRH